MLEFLRSRPGTTLLFLAVAVVAWLGLFDRAERALLPTTPAQAGQERLEANLTRAAALFGTARALNAVISVLQSTEVTGGVVVAQGTVSPGQALDPLNDLVERFSSVMLTATVALTGSVLLVQAGDLYGFAVLLPAGLVLAAAALWLPGGAGAAMRRAGLILLLAAAIAKLGLPATVMATEAVAERLVDPLLESGDARLRAIQLPGLDSAGTTAEGTGETGGMLETLRQANDIPAQINRAIAGAASLADAVVDLTVAYAIKIVVLPLLTLWLIARLAEVLIGGLLPRRQGP